MQGKSDLTHTTIEKSPQLHAEVIAKVMALATPSRPKPKTAPALPPKDAAAAAKPATEVTGSTPAAPAATTAGVAASAPPAAH
jgi:hypothetical protein